MASIEIETFYPYAIEKVWEALATKECLSEWLMQTDFEPRVGHRFQFRAKPQPGWRGFVDCEVLEVEPPRRLVYSWQGDEKPKLTRVAWTLTPGANGTHVKLEHTGFEGIGGFILSRLMMGPGWKKKLTKALTTVIERLNSGVPA